MSAKVKIPMEMVPLPPTPDAATARGGSGGEPPMYEPLRLIGQGSFGVVVLARARDTGRAVAVKRVLSDGRLRHRELALLRDCLGPRQARTKQEQQQQQQQQQQEPSAHSNSRSNDSHGSSSTCIGSHQGNSKSDDMAIPPISAALPTIIPYHPNVVRLLDHFYSRGPNGERQLNLVMDYLPLDIHRLNSQYVRQRQQRMPLILVKAVIFQVARALTFLHARGICHRDVKPSNLIVDQETCVVKLCDFGSAKVMQPIGAEGPREKNVPYICSRYYRAPELLLGSFHYHFHVDMWALGCVLAELLCGQVLFKGSSTVDQMAEIFKVLGAPSRQEMHALNPQGAEAFLPPVEPSGGGGYMQWYHALKAKSLHWQSILPPGTSPAAVSLVGQLLRYTPEERLSAADVLEHPFFDELFLDTASLPGGTPLPVSMFQVTEDEAESFPAWLLERMAAAEGNAAERRGSCCRNSRTSGGSADAMGQ